VTPVSSSVKPGQDQHLLTRYIKGRLNTSCLASAISVSFSLSCFPSYNQGVQNNSHGQKGTRRQPDSLAIIIAIADNIYGAHTGNQALFILFNEKGRGY
jgi:hypothetical protein